MRCCCGLSPSAPLWGHVPGAVRRLFDFQTRADIRVRVRSIVIRIRIRHTAIRVRIVVPAIDHTAYWEMPPSCYKGKQYMPKSCKNTTVSAQYGASRPFFKKKSTGFAGRVLSLRSRFDALAYAFSLNDLYATTLDALTSFPRKARREPTNVLVLVASLNALAFDTPPFAYATLYPR